MFLISKQSIKFELHEVRVLFTKVLTSNDAMFHNVGMVECKICFRYIDIKMRLPFLWARARISRNDIWPSFSMVNLIDCRSSLISNAIKYIVARI